MKLSACLIVKGDNHEAEYLKGALASLSGHVDEICVTITHKPGEKRNYATEKVAKKYKAIISDFEWIDDFATARNYNFAQATGDWVIWLDADDRLEHGEKLREIASNTPQHISVLYVNYDYETDENGVVRTRHWRDRMLRNDGSIIWKGRLHETPVESRRVGHAQVPELNVVHMAKPDRWEESEKRNIRILEAQLQDEKSEPDPRTMFYLACAYKGQGRGSEAAQLMELYLTLSGWDHERSVCWVQLGEIYEAQNRDSDATNAYLQAIKERPDFPMGYVSLGQFYAHKQKWEQALYWLEMALSKGETDTSMVINPLDFTYRPLILAAECFYNLGKIDQAIDAVKQAAKYRADDLTSSLLEEYNLLKGHKLATEAVVSLAKYLEANDEQAKVTMLLDAVPESLQDNPLIGRIRRKYTAPKVWPKKSVVIFTGNNAIGEWGPWSLDEGIGGSEEAVVRLSRRLVEQGYAVTVYANPGSLAGDWQGSKPYVFDPTFDVDNSYVTWRNFWELDLRDTFDVFVAWRSPWFFDAKVDARKKYLWLHDVMPAGEFTPDRLANLDKVIVLSKYHRSLFPNIPDDKIMLSANGIDADDYTYEEAGERFLKCADDRDPHTIIYQSSHVRGLSHLYDIWPEVKKAVPDAKLRIMYGWDSYVAINKDNPERMQWMEQMKRRCEELADVVDIGKVSQQQIVEEALDAGVWAYPCTFPEISCITAMKAQAGGAIPVSSNFGALDETVQYGYKLDLGDEWNDGKAKAAYTKALIDALTNPTQDRAQMAKGALKRFSWTNVAKQWIEEWEK